LHHCLCLCLCLCLLLLDSFFSVSILYLSVFLFQYFKAIKRLFLFFLLLILFLPPNLFLFVFLTYLIVPPHFQNNLNQENSLFYKPIYYQKKHFLTCLLYQPFLNFIPVFQIKFNIFNLFLIQKIIM
jgi:hypothetical protein